MATLIPNRQLTEIKEMTVEQLRLMAACEVYDGDSSFDGNYLYTHIPHNIHDSIVADYIRTQAEYLGMKSNSIIPMVSEVEPPAPPPPPTPLSPPLQPVPRVKKSKRRGRRRS